MVFLHVIFLPQYIPLVTFTFFPPQNFESFIILVYLFFRDLFLFAIDNICLP